jgi:hypothetical protein
MAVEGQDQFLMVVSLRWVLEPTVISKFLKPFIEFVQSPRAHNVGFHRVVSADIEFNYATAGHTIPDPSVLVWIIAHAQCDGGTAVSNENRVVSASLTPKIPNICHDVGVGCIGLPAMLTKLKFKFGK